MPLFASQLESPVGRIAIVVNRDGAVRHLLFAGDNRREELAETIGDELSWHERPCEPAMVQIKEYFQGTRKRFELDLDLQGTDFQISVWQELQRIRYGATISYRQLAERVGRPSATRAVGLANGRNPIPIIVPCHRVIGADGSLTGFGGGLHVKRALLVHEGALLI
jgi:methylated-DNA-[protein]-cysteine S-methyltransferase